MGFVLEHARLDDADAAATLIAQTDAELFRFVAGDLAAWELIATHEWRHERGVYYHELARVVRCGGTLAGVLVGYTLDLHNRIDWSMSSALAHLAPELVARIQKTRGITPFLFPSFPAHAWYVQNLAVRPDTQGTGLGRFLMNAAAQLARDAGCTEIHLDVAGDNPAVEFYRRIGYTVLIETCVPAFSRTPHLRLKHSLPS